MNQLKVIEQISTWLKANMWSDSLEVRCDHVTQWREELALFVGPKLPGAGRGNRIAQVDILVADKNSQAVELIIEVDPNPNPKKLLGDLMAVLLADNYTPSNKFTGFRVVNTLVVFLTVLDGRKGSQKTRQFEIIEEATRKKLDLRALGIRDVCLCHGRNEDEAIMKCQELVRSHFLA